MQLKGDISIKQVNRVHEILGIPAGSKYGVPTLPLPNQKPSDETIFWDWKSRYGHYFAEASLGMVNYENLRGETEWANIFIYYVGVHQFIDAGFMVMVRRDGVSYFTWTACEHEFRESNVGKCLHRYTCKKCEQFYEVDSSD